MHLQSVLVRGILSIVITIVLAVEVSAGVPTCYLRSYDARHLAKNPHQTVTFMELALKEGSGEYQIWLTRRGKRTLYYNAGRCDRGNVKGKSGLYCHALMDCDGDCGSFGLVFEREGSLLAHFRVSKGSFSLHSYDGYDVLVPELDDGVFRLHRQPASTCAFNPEYEDRVQPTSAGYAPLPFEHGFISPSGNIQCRVFDGDEADRSLTCVIGDIAREPKPPAWCKDDWGGMFTVGQSGVGERVCHSDTIETDGLQIIPYGSEWVFKGFRCSSAREGVTCRNRHGNGFFLSRAKQSVF